MLATAEMSVELEELHRQYHTRRAAITEESQMAAEVLAEQFEKATASLAPEGAEAARMTAIYETHSLKAEYDTLVAIGRLSRDYERSLATLLTLFQKQGNDEQAGLVAKEQAWVAEDLKTAGDRAREIKALQEPPPPPPPATDDGETGEGGDDTDDAADATPFKIRKAIDSALLQLNRQSIGAGTRGAGIGYYIELEGEEAANPRARPPVIQASVRIPNRTPVFIGYREPLKTAVTHVIPIETVELVLDAGPPYDPLVVPVELKTRERVNLGRLVIKKTVYEGTAAIVGTVTDGVTGHPVTNATVTALDKKCVTDEHGGYRLDGFIPSVISLAVSSPGYVGRGVDAALRQ
ncbi:MAG: carboxypeptidase-like regulatory domain-containing protein, partial [Kiritimatiellaeota bacterium]|nr:carboxypeptidase-like regulatory domain-containing protein [Kiritimatiellota bacterium]